MLEKRHGKLDPTAPTGLAGKPDFEEKSVRIVILYLALVLAVLTMIVSAKPVYRFLKRERALKFAAQSERYLREENINAAGTRVHAALGLAPNEPAVLRAAARLSSKLRLREAIPYWDMLLKTSAATREDYLGSIEHSLNLSRSDLAGPPLTVLLGKNPHDKDALRLMVRQFRQDMRSDEATAAARIWLTAHPQEEEAAFVLGSLLLYRAAREERTEGRRLLWTLALGHGVYRTRAAELLVLNEEMTRGENEGLISALLAQSKVPLAELLAAASLRIKIDPQRRLEQIDSLLSQLPTDLTEEGLALLSNWLVDQGAAERALALLPIERARDQGQLLAARLRALGMSGRWGEVGELIERDERAKVLEPFLRHCYAAATDLRKGVAGVDSIQNTVLGHFQNALHACSNRVAPIRFVAAYAEALGQNRAAISAHQRLMDYAPLLVPSGKAILKLVEPLDDIRVQRATLKRLLDFMPGELAFQLQSSYLACLENRDVGEARKFLLQHLTAFPNDSYAKGTLALAEFRLANSEEALRILDEIPWDWNAVHARWSAIRAAILGANLDRVAARATARRIENARLRPEERQLIEPWL